MREIKAGYHQRLASISAITTRLSIYRGKPAIFTRSPVPDDADFPFIVIRDSIADNPNDTKTTTGRDTLNDIQIYGDDTGDPDLVEDLATLVRDSIHRNPITVSGYGSLIASATGPVEAPTEDRVYGRTVQAGLTLIRA